MTIEADIYTLLTGHVGLSALVSTRVYPMVLPDDATLPAISYRLISAPRPRAMGSDTGDVRARYQFNIYDTAGDFDGVKAVSEQLRDCLQRYRGTDTVTITAVFHEEDNWNYDWDPKYAQMSVDYQINYKE